MSTTTELQTALATLEAERVELQRRRDEATVGNDVTQRRNLRERIGQVEEDIAEIHAALKEDAQWATSAERAVQIKAARAEVETAKQKFATLQQGMAKFEAGMRDVTALAAELTELHESIPEHVLQALRLQHARDPARRSQQSEMLIPLAAGNTALLALSFADSLRKLLNALPCAQRIEQDYMSPNKWTRWAAAPTLTDTFAQMKDEFTSRLSEIQKGTS